MVTNVGTIITERRTIMSVKLTLFALLAAVSVIPAGAQANAGSEVAIATDHAGYAVAGMNIDAIHMHLHHAVNCLVGPQDKSFDSAVENPCAKEGNGAIPDATTPETKAKLQSIVRTAEIGINANDQSTAKKAATDAYNALKAIQ